MKSPFYFIVKPFNNKRYDNVKKYGDIDFITSTSKEDASSSNRYAEVVEVPNNYDGDIKIGDTLLVHHNVFKYYTDMGGKERSGKSFLKDGLFFVDFDQFFLYKTDGKWNTHGKYCFIKPVDMGEYYIHTSITEQPLTGEVAYVNDELISLGVNEGDRVLFQPNSEYEFNVDGVKMYRMFTSNITMKWM